MLELIFVDGNRRGEVIRLTFEKAWFGRQATCDFVLLGEGISRAHFYIERRGNDFVLIDNKSTNGTFVNRVRTSAVTLRAGYDIVAGSNEMQVREVADVSRAPFRFSAERKGGQGGAQVIEQSTVLLGRKSICQVQLNEPSVSAVHAELDYRGAEGVWITDQSSGAGVYINGQRVVSQRLRNGDVVTIRPFEITIGLSDEMCVLGIRDCEEESQAAPPPNLPGAYSEVVAASHTAQAGEAKPSAAIAALPHWMQAKAPIWVPTSDILPNHFRTGMLVACLVGVLAWGTYAWAAKRNTVYSPGPLTENHAAFECASCHVSFNKAPNASCQVCHADVHAADNQAAAIHEAFECSACHSEHRGASFDMARNVASGCQAAGCHLTVHAKENLLMAGQKPPSLSVAIPRAVAFEVRFQDFGEKPDDPMHTKHLAAVNGECGSCHTGGDPSVKVAREDMRARCLTCHGFGPEATLGQRCYSCHFMHATMTPETILTTVRFPESGTGKANLAEGNGGGILVFVAAIVAVPVFYFGIAAGSWRVTERRFRARTEKVVRDAPPVTSAPEPRAGPPPTTAIVKPSENRAPGGNLRPQIDLDLCVGCATCVHVCPFNVLEIVNEKAIAVRLEDCTGFAACAAECPTEAIKLVEGGAMQTVELPAYDATLETNVPGLYLAGEVTGKALIKIAINQGKKVVESIVQKRPQPGNHFDVIVVGAGPAGTSAALAAVQDGLKVLVLEQGTQANTIRNFPRQKFVMAEPVMIPLYGPLWMEDTSKESLLERWQQIIATTGLSINEEEKVLRVINGPAGFVVQSTKGQYQGARVVLAIGKRGSPRKLGVPGEDSTKVAYTLSDAEAYHGKAICVVGGGDSGIEAANGLARPDLENRVWLVHQGEDFGRAKPRNQKKIQKNVNEGRITVFFTSGVTEIRDHSTVVKTPAGIEEIPNNFVFVMIGGENPKKFLTECGIEFSQRALG